MRETITIIPTVVRTGEGGLKTELRIAPTDCVKAESIFYRAVVRRGIESLFNQKGE